MEQTLINLLKLNFDLDDFYSILINPKYYPNHVTLQGEFTPEKLIKYTNLGFVFSGDNNNFQATKDKMKINLF